jgi:hypothetical protein
MFRVIFHRESRSAMPAGAACAELQSFHYFDVGRDDISGIASVPKMNAF